MSDRMNKRTACHMLADINEAIYDCEKNLEDIDFRLSWDEQNRDWLLECQEQAMAKLEELKSEHDDFLEMYSDIIYS